MPPPPASSSSRLILYRGWPTQGHHVWSPFVVKLETRLRFAGVPYECRAGNPIRAPRGKIPYVDIPAAASAATASSGGDKKPTQMGDSGLITRHLIESGVLPDLNAKLSPQQRELDLATRALLEDKLFFYHTRERWLENYYTMRDHVLSAVPWPARILVGQIKYRGFYKSLYGQGTMRYSRKEARATKEEIWSNINGVLSTVRSKSLLSSPAADPRAPFWFLGGEAPTEVDATLFGFIISVLMCSAGPESRQIVGQHPVLVNYAERIHDKYFADYSKWESGVVGSKEEVVVPIVEQQETPRLATTTTNIRT